MVIAVADEGSEVEGSFSRGAWARDVKVDEHIWPQKIIAFLNSEA